MIKVDYIQHCGSDIMVVNAARVSFGKKITKITDKDKKLIKYLADNNHMSPFEHLILTVKISVPLYIRSQIMRHRTFAYNEISRRYTDKDLEFYVPETLRRQHSSNRQASEGNIDPLNNEILATAIMMHQSKCLDFYNLLLEKGVCREQARGVLSQDLITEFYMTGNLRNWSHFIALRQHEGAQIEVQEVAKNIRDILIDKFGYAAEVLLNNKETRDVSK